MSLRQLILLRHAHAEPQVGGQSDADRALSPRGVTEADDAAAWLKGHALPQRVVVSPARRAQQTWERVRAATGLIEQVTDERIYDATPGHLIDVIEAHRDVERLMLVGHNPGFESLAALLSTGQSGDHRGMPPGGVAILTFSETAILEPGAAELTAFWAP